jgi:hypothetical protein
VNWWEIMLAGWLLGYPFAAVGIMWRREEARQLTIADYKDVVKQNAAITAEYEARIAKRDGDYPYYDQPQLVLLPLVMHEHDPALQGLLFGFFWPVAVVGLVIYEVGKYFLRAMDWICGGFIKSLAKLGRVLAHAES